MKKTLLIVLIVISSVMCSCQAQFTIEPEETSTGETTESRVDGETTTSTPVDETTSGETTSSADGETTTSAPGDETTNRFPPPEPFDYVYFFDSYEELATFFSPDESGKSDAQDDAELHGDEYVSFVNDISTEKERLLMPIYNDAPLLLRDKEGFQSITLFTSELYGRPWIWYHCELYQKSITINVMLLNDEEKGITGNCSDLIASIAPDAPNVNNYEPFQKYYKRIYNDEITLADKTVSAMIHEAKDSNELYVMFVYNEMLILINAESEVLTDEFFSNLAFAPCS